MKVLHTSDWHLGQNFMNNTREAEHQMALDWVVDMIREHKIEVFILAGDVFDIGNPPSYARRLYYDFLRKLIKTACRHIIITGGNHDSPSMLNAPAELLKIFNIHVVGAATGKLEDEILELKNDQGALEMVVAAVPFLRERDLRYSVAGESGSEQAKHLRKAIVDHYKSLAKLMIPYEKSGVPIITTGHLYAAGATASAKQDNIYIGNMENIGASEFPALFDYVALGHIHRPQNLGKQRHIRYSGSIIPLSFSEIKDQKSVVVLTFKGKTIQKTDIVEVPVYRQLKSVHGDLKTIRERLRKLDQKFKDTLPHWVEVIVETEEVTPRLDIDIREFAKDMNLEILRVKIQRKQKGLEATLEDDVALDDLDELDVFKKKCETFGVPEKEVQGYVDTFLELRDWMAEQEED
jgi:exonuclease SbcD